MGLRVLHCPYCECGNASSLAQAERNEGLASWAVTLRPDPYGMPCDENVFKHDRTSFMDEARRIRLLQRALTDWDVIHFNFGSTILPMRSAGDVAPRGGLFRRALRSVNAAYCRIVEMRDLPLLRAAGKGIVMTYQGSDARQIDVCRERFRVSTALVLPDSPDLRAVDALKRERIQRVAAYADQIYALNPDLLHVLPENAQFLPYAHISLTDWKPAERPLNPRPLVVHAPSNPLLKGTPHVLAAVERLLAGGIDFDFRLIHGIPRDEARRLYECADLVIDQLYAGWYGGFAAELMALGKPVITYIRTEDLTFVPPTMAAELPIINAEPSSIYDVLRDWLTRDREALVVRGRASRAYMERWHEPQRIAGDLVARYREILDHRKHSGAVGTPQAAPRRSRRGPV